VPKKTLRLLLVALLVVMVPLQGFAALSVGICRDLQHGSDAQRHDFPASTPAAESHSHDGHGAIAGATGHDTKAAGDSSGSHCAACAACGASAAIVAPNLFSIAEAPRDGVLAHSVMQFSGFVPDGLDRPPLTPLA